jgi:hypothetical protein
VDEPSEPPANVEHWRTGAALTNWARREHAYRSRGNLARGNETVVIIDDATPAAHLMNVVVETVGRHGKHTNDFARRNVSFTDRYRRARRVPIEL